MDIRDRAGQSAGNRWQCHQGLRASAELDWVRRYRSATAERESVPNNDVSKNAKLRHQAVTEPRCRSIRGAEMSFYLRLRAPSPFGRGQGESLRICRNSDPHPTRSNLCFALSG